MTNVTTYREWTVGLTTEAVGIWEKRAERFKALGQTVVRSTLEMAHILTQAKEELPHGNFQSWCVESLGMSKQQVSNTLKAAETLLKVSDPEAFSGCSLRTLAVMSSADSEQLETAMEIQGMLGKLTEQRARQIVQSDGGADLDADILWLLTDRLQKHEYRYEASEAGGTYFDRLLDFQHTPEGEDLRRRAGDEVFEYVLEQFRTALPRRLRDAERSYGKALRLTIRGLLSIEEYLEAHDRFRLELSDILVEDWFGRWIEGEPVEASCPLVDWNGI